MCLHDIASSMPLWVSSGGQGGQHLQGGHSQGDRQLRDVTVPVLLILFLKDGLQVRPQDP